jgi:prepilin-type N-terminal cleavage/methylation domain-containing protein
MIISHARSRAFTLVEIVVAMGVICIMAYGVFEVLLTGTFLVSKNSALNVSNVQGHRGMLMFENDLHAAASTPQLVDATGTNVVTSGPSAGISFKAYAGGPFYLYVSGSSVSISGSSTSISIVTGSQGQSADYQPLPGQILNIQALPNGLVSGTVSSVGAWSSKNSCSVYSLALAAAIGSSINIENQATNNSALSVACFLTTPVSYYVQNGALWRMGLNSSGSQVSTVEAWNVSSATPFSVATVNGVANPTFISVANFTAFDPSSSNRVYYSVTTPFTLQVPHYAQLTTLY